ncbi:MAG TPA: DNA replication and repair protein RecF, partial [Acidimicrobiales bacterium]|nr:DNA replication and repair protein RecF [Acidimicrobiales bacterium]
MAVTGLWVADFRCFAEAELHPEPEGLTVLRGANGAGKTSILEAVGWLATRRSIRGAPREALVRTGAGRAILRAETEDSAAGGGRRGTFEAEIPVAGPARLQVNRHPVRSRAEAAATLDVTVFSPDDLDLVQGGPAGRRAYLDEVLAARHARSEALAAEVERILRQRAALLRQAGGRLDDSAGATLDVWDERLARSGTALAGERAALAEALGPLAAQAYTRLAGGAEDLVLRYRRSWEGDLADALARARPDDLRRQVTTVGPHRDD